MPENSMPTIQLDTGQANRLIDIAGRWYALVALVDPVYAMVDPKWERPLAEAKTELLETVWFLVEILRPALPELQPDGLNAISYVRDLSVSFSREHAERLAEFARVARLRSHRLHPLLTEVPEESVTFWDARKIVDRLAFHAGELLDYVRLIDPSLAAAAARASERG